MVNKTVLKCVCFFVQTRDVHFENKVSKTIVYESLISIEHLDA